jgi:hypothetical protein
VPDEALQRAEARVAIRAGRLPRREPDRVFGGPGSGRPCRVCKRPITHDETEYELQFAHAGARPLIRFYVHCRCFAAWDLERTRP